MSVENNHSHDLDSLGKSQTIQALTQQGIAPLTFNESPRFFTIKNKVVSIISLSLVPDRGNTQLRLPSVALQQKIRLARSLSHVVIVFIHWGSELLSWPNNQQRSIARQLTASGVDIIIGAHPHVIQPAELINGKPVFFSLGNHLFDQKYPETKQGLMLALEISDNAFRCTALRTHTKRGSFFPQQVAPDSLVFNNIALSNKPLVIDGFTIIPQNVYFRGESRIVLHGQKNCVEHWHSHPMPLLSLSVEQLDGQHEFLFALERYFSTLDKTISIRPYVYQVDPSGMFARWRGSALAWPLIDARFAPTNDTILCARHSSASYLTTSASDTSTHLAAYHWNGFGFSGVNDSVCCRYCSDAFR